MKKSLCIWLLLGLMSSGSLFSQNKLQLGLNHSMGISLTRIDFSEANAEFLITPKAIAVPLGLELAWLPTSYLRISTGMNFTYYDIRVQRPALGFYREWFTDNLTFYSLPLEVSYRLPSRQNDRRSSIFILGGAYDIWSITDRARGRTSLGTVDGVDYGATTFFRTQTPIRGNASARFGLGQEWKLGKRERFNLQLFVMYNMGLMPIWEGEFSFWNEFLTDGFPENATIETVLGEPLEQYDSITSNGSYITLGWRLYFAFNP